MNSPFDETRYRGLLERLEAVEIKYSDLQYEFRLDPEFFKKEHLEIEERLLKLGSKALGEVCNLYDGPFGSELLSDDYSESGIPLLRMQNVSELGGLELSGVEFVSKEKADYLKKYQAFPGDVVVTKIGFLGYGTVLTDAFEKYVFRRELTKCEIIESDLYPYYLASFFNSRYGRSQFYRFASGTTRDRILLTSQRYILVPRFSGLFQNKIEACIQKSY